MNAIAAWDAIVDLGEGGLDPWNLYPINKKQVDRASSGAWASGIMTPTPLKN